MPFLVSKQVSGHTYYYLRHNERVQGQTRSAWEIYLGRLSELTKLLRPIGPQQGAPKPEARVVEFGAVAALWDLAERLQVLSIIDKCAAPVRGGLGVGQYMLLAAINRCVDPCSKRGMVQWYEQTALSRWMPARPHQLSSQRFWDAMGRLDEKKLRAIELEIDRRLITEFGVSVECLAYDATNFFTYIDSRTPSELAKRGKNKERRIDLRQISLALLVSRDFHIPLLHQAYPGNRPDAPQFSRVVEELATRHQTLYQQCEQVTLIFDKGNNSKDNIQKLGKFHFVGSLVPTQHPDLLAIGLEKFVPLEGRRLQGVKAYRTSKEVFDRPVTLVMTFNPELYEAQLRGLSQHRSKAEVRLQELQERLDRWRESPQRGKRPTRPSVRKQVGKILKARHLKDLYLLKIDKTPGGLKLSWALKDQELRRLQEHFFGRTIIFTDQHSWTNEQIVLGYRGQYQIEEAFHWMKAPEIARWWPMHHWTDQKIRVHAFYCVLALTLLSLLQRQLAAAGYDWGIKKILQVLGGIPEVELIGASTGNSLVMTRMNREAKALYKHLNLERYLAD